MEEVAMAAVVTAMEEVAMVAVVTAMEAGAMEAVVMAISWRLHESFRKQTASPQLAWYQ